MKVLLLNRDLTHSAAPQQFQGYSGKTYGVSRWNGEYNCHTVELTLDQYEACWDDVQRALPLIMRRWFPRFIVPAPVKQFSVGYEAGMDNKELPNDSTFSTQSGWTAAHAETGDFKPPTSSTVPATAPTPAAPPVLSAPSKIYAESELRQIGKKFFSLVPIAKLLGIDPKKGEGGEALIKAILDTQRALLAAA